VQNGGASRTTNFKESGKPQQYALSWQLGDFLFVFGVSGKGL
jgi:hypothetical protein